MRSIPNCKSRIDFKTIPAKSDNPVNIKLPGKTRIHSGTCNVRIPLGYCIVPLQSLHLNPQTRVLVRLVRLLSWEALVRLLPSLPPLLLRALLLRVPSF